MPRTMKQEKSRHPRCQEPSALQCMYLSLDNTGIYSSFGTEIFRFHIWTRILTCWTYHLLKYLCGLRGRLQRRYLYLRLVSPIVRTICSAFECISLTQSLGLTAIAFLTICAANIVYQSPEIYSEMFVVPLGALFAFSSIRANFPGAPVGFGMSPICLETY